MGIVMIYKHFFFYYTIAAVICNCELLFIIYTLYPCTQSICLILALKLCGLRETAILRLKIYVYLEITYVLTMHIIIGGSNYLMSHTQMFVLSQC